MKTKKNNKAEINDLKPFAQRVKTALELGEAHYVNTIGKNIYIYNL